MKMLAMIIEKYENVWKLSEAGRRSLKAEMSTVSVPLTAPIRFGLAKPSVIQSANSCAFVRKRNLRFLVFF
jgi:hypothetical protein